MKLPKNWLPPEEYFPILPKKRMGTGALFFNREGKVLLVKPTYKDYWSIPGGSVDENESPRAAAIRETKEEIGFEPRNLRLAAVDYVAVDGIKTESLQFIFYGGVLTSAEIDRIKVDGEEVDDYCFVSLKRALKMVSMGVTKKISHWLEGIKNGGALYLENGQKAD